jgi:hypothetical protein
MAFNIVKNASGSVSFVDVTTGDIKKMLTSTASIEVQNTDQITITDQTGQSWGVTYTNIANTVIGGVPTVFNPNTQTLQDLIDILISSFFFELSGVYKVINSVSDLPALVGGEYPLLDDACYMITTLLNLANPIKMGNNTILKGCNNLTDGIQFSGTGGAIIGTDANFTLSELEVICTDPLGVCIVYNETGKNESLTVKDCIFGAGKVAEITGGFIVAFTGNYISSASTDGIEFMGGSYTQVEVANNICDSVNSSFQLRFTGGNYDSIGVFNNEFEVFAGNTGIIVDPAVTITNNGGGIISSNNFAGAGTPIIGIEDDTVDWTLEVNGARVLSTSARRFVRKLRNKQQLVDFLALPNPSDYVYEIDGSIDMTDTSIVVPSTGLTFKGYGNNFSKLCTTSDNASLFTGGGNIFFNDMILEASGLNSKIFNVTDPTGSNAIEFVNVNFQNSTELGILNGYRQGLILNGFFLNISEGFTFQGTWSGGMRVDTTLGLLFSSLTLFKSDVGHSFGSRFVSNMNHITGASATCYDFREDTFISDAGFQLVEANFSGSGTFVTGGITNTSIKSFWRDNVGISDTFQGLVYQNASDTATTISIVSTYVELAIDKSILEETWFSSNSAVLYSANYDSSLGINIAIELFGSYTSGNNNQIELEIRNYRTSLAGGFDVLGNLVLSTNGGGAGDRAEAASFKAFDTIALGDDIRVFVRNNTGTTDITTIAGAQLIISKR